jgi:hypothetical protein
MVQPNYKKYLFIFLIITAAIKIIFSGLMELGNDEVYYYTYALQPDYSHFDHPPMVGIFIQLTSLNLLWLSEISLRLGAILGCVISSIFIFNIGKIISSEKTGWYATVIYNICVYTGFIGGFFILPDSAQMPFYTASLYIMCILIFKEEDKNFVLWLLLGLCIGLATLSKIHGLFLWVGLGLFILLKRISLLKNWRLYVAALITLLCLIPIVYWNIENNFITYKFHSARVAHHQILWDSFLQELGGEFIYQNPFIFILIIISIVYFIRKKIFNTKTIWLLCMSLPLIFVFWGTSLFNEILPHWNGPAYIPLFFIAAQFLEDKSKKIFFPNVLKYAGLLVFVVLLSATFIINLSPINFGSQKKENLGEDDFTLDMSGWKNFGNNFAQLTKEDFASGKMKRNAVILTHKWFPGGHLEFYVARKTNLNLLGIGKLNDLHKFAWLNTQHQPLQLGDDAYCIVPSNLPVNVNEVYGKYFTVVEEPVVIDQLRGGKVVRYFYVYRLKSCKQIPENPLQ